MIRFFYSQPPKQEHRQPPPGSPFRICVGCATETSRDPMDFVCTDCMEWFYERRCWVLTRGQWDASKMHNWEEVEAAWAGLLW